MPENRTRLDHSARGGDILMSMQYHHFIVYELLLLIVASAILSLYFWSFNVNVCEWHNNTPTLLFTKQRLLKSDNLNCYVL